MASRPLIIVIGSLNMDVVIKIPRMPEAAETLTAHSMHISAGGKGANQAIACARAGFSSVRVQELDVRMIGAVGMEDNHFTTLLRPAMLESGVDTSGVMEIQGLRTGTSTIMLQDEGENSILFYPGANYEGLQDFHHILNLSTSTVTPNRPADVVVLQGEIPYETTVYLLKHFNHRTNRPCVVFNPAPMFPEGIAAEALRGLAFLVLNETECLTMGKSLDLTFPSQGSGSAAISAKDLQMVAEEFITRFSVHNVIITMGSRGTVFVDNRGNKKFTPATFVEKVVDTTAAGDTFVGYLAAALARALCGGVTLEQFNVTEAVERASEAAAKSVARFGASRSIPFAYE